MNRFDTEAGRYLAHTETAGDRVDRLTVTRADTARVERRLTELAPAPEGAERPANQPPARYCDRHRRIVR